MRKVVPILVLLAAAGGCSSPTPEPQTGPVLEEYGRVFHVPGAARTGDPDDGVRAVFDIASSSDDPADVNPRIENVARFLNLHVRAGFPREHVRAALVLHGRASKDALGHRAYRKRHKTDNPNLDLLTELEKAGVRIYLCGQSAARRGYARDEVAEPVNVGLSAMTVLAQLQADGYALIP